MHFKYFLNNVEFLDFMKFNIVRYIRVALLDNLLILLGEYVGINIIDYNFANISFEIIKVKPMKNKL